MVNLSTTVPLEKLNATYDAVFAALTRYIKSIDTGYLDKIPYYSYFYPTEKTNFKQALIDFRDKELLTIRSELQQDVSRINVKSVSSAMGKG